MKSLGLNKPVLITQRAALEQLAQRLMGESIVAVDTESNSLYAYREQVCLVQFSTAHQDYLVDPLALKDLSALAPVFADPQVEKVFHAAEYDLIVLKNDFGFDFAHLFDTMLAARILGWNSLGLGAILEAQFGVKLDKRYQRANWGQRPLPGDMLTYARLDTHYLIALRHRQLSELKAKNLWPLAREDFRRLRQVNGRELAEAATTCWRISGACDLSPQQAAVLQEVCLYRDQVAKSIDRPLFKVMHDRVLLALAKAAPGDLEALRRVSGMSARMIERHGKALLRAIQRGLHAPPLYPPSSPRPSDLYLNRLEALRNWRKARARKMGVNSDVVLPRDLLNELAARSPEKPDELAAIMNTVPWRLERFGEEILNTLDRA